MAKDKVEPTAETEQTPPLAPASYKLVGLEEGVGEVYVPLLSRSYTIKDLQRPDLAELLHGMGWPHIEKN